MTGRLDPVPRDRVEIRRLAAPRGDAIPNNDRFPALIFVGALGGTNDPADIHALYARNGWGGGWTWEVFPFHHFHPDAFETLAVASGGARLMLGGPQGEEIDVTAGDVIVLPPGYGHRLIEKRDGFAVCGAYPANQENYSTLRDSDGYDAGVLAIMREVPSPEKDPVYGLSFTEAA